jgi:hypothetical protein
MGVFANCESVHFCGMRLSFENIVAHGLHVFDHGPTVGLGNLRCASLTGNLPAAGADTALIGEQTQR